MGVLEGGEVAGEEAGVAAGAEVVAGVEEEMTAEEAGGVEAEVEEIEETPNALKDPEVQPEDLILLGTDIPAARAEDQDHVTGEEKEVGEIHTGPPQVEKTPADPQTGLIERGKNPLGAKFKDPNLQSRGWRIELIRRREIELTRGRAIEG